MKLLHNIGPRHNSNYNTIEEILACDQPLSFDGIYRNVFEHADRLVGKDITLFVMGDYVGLDNSFDRGVNIRERYCSWEELFQLRIKLHARIGWHSWSHRDLTTLSDNEVLKEITPPYFLPVDTFAYPYGTVDERVERIVRESAIYSDAWSVTQGNGSDFQKRRTYLNW